MFSNDKNIQEVNTYFHQFITSKFDYALKHPPFNNATNNTLLYHSDWNWIMNLIQLIERSNIVPLLYVEFHNNYCRFYSPSGIGRIHQDKGRNLIEAMYICCYNLLQKYWKEKEAPLVSMLGEPFSIDEFDDDIQETEPTIDKIERMSSPQEKRFNDEGFKEQESRAFFGALTNEQLTSMYNITRKQNPHLPKFIQWMKEELDSRNK